MVYHDDSHVWGILGVPTRIQSYSWSIPAFEYIEI